jgi:hypothetical protein
LDGLDYYSLNCRRHYFTVFESGTALEPSRCASHGLIHRNDQFVPGHAELGALLLNNNRSVRPLIGMTRTSLLSAAA